MVYSSAKCQNVFSIEGHVPTCKSERDGTCLTRGQKSVIASIFGGAETSKGEADLCVVPLRPGPHPAGLGRLEIQCAVYP